MKTVAVPWKAWHGDEVCTLAFPESWDVQVWPMADARALTLEEIRSALLFPVGSLPLERVAKGKKSAAIAVDDLTRPTPASELLSVVLDCLRRAGIKREQIKIIVALGAHPPMSERDVVKKVGGRVAEGYRIVQHHPLESVEEVGINLDSVPVRINREFLRSDLKIAMGCITPHPFAGFTGGGKMVLPGLAGLEVIERTHRCAFMGFRGGLGIVEGNQFRDEVEQICRKVGVDLIIDVVVNHAREVAGVFIGEVKEAFLNGVAFARRVYRTALPGEVEVAVVNAYPKDTDLIQSENAFNPLRSGGRQCVRSDGKVVLMTAASHGRGAHGLLAPGGRLYRKPRRKQWLEGRELIVYSPSVGEEDVRSLFWSGYRFYERWDGVLDDLQKSFGDRCRVAVFPHGSLQMGMDE